MLSTTHPAPASPRPPVFNPALALHAAGHEPATSWNEGPVNPVAQEQAMWRAVIVQALMDASCGSQKYEAAQARREALVWLRGTSQDFATVCYYAGFEPEFVRKMVKRSLDHGCQWRALPGEGTRVRQGRPSRSGKAKQRR